MKNFDLVKLVLENIFYNGVEQICICPGSRNAPFIEVLDKHTNKFKVHYFFEEREAAFFALHENLQGNKTAVITTSGTAVAELLPACIESYYQKCSTIFITADRPKSYRGSAAPQSIEQVKIFNLYSDFYDLDKNEAELNSELSLNKPSHINVCFEEPLIDKNSINLRFKQKYDKPQELTDDKTNETIVIPHKKPLIIVSQINSEKDRRFVCEKLNQLKVPVFLESLSGINKTELRTPPFSHGDRFLEILLQQKYFDSVIRIGKVPLTSVWRKLEKQYQNLPVYSFSPDGFSGLARNSKVYHHYDFSFQFSLNYDDIIKKQKSYSAKIEELLNQYPLSEASFFTNFSKILSSDDSLYLGNSLPIRYWQNYSLHNKAIRLGANRGANGIDGQVASFFGFSNLGKKNTAVLGDLTFFYGISALALAKLKEDTAYTIYVINNEGGKIFEAMYESKKYQCKQDIKIQSIAEAFGFSYEVCDDFKQIPKPICSTIVEVKPDNKQSWMFNQKVKEYES